MLYEVYNVDTSYGKSENACAFNRQHTRGIFRPFNAFVSRFRFTRIVSKCKELIKILFSYLQEVMMRYLPIFFIHELHDSFHLKARAVEQMRGSGAIFILVAVLVMQPRQVLLRSVDCEEETAENLKSKLQTPLCKCY